MKNNDDIPTTETTEIKQLIYRIKQGELDEGDSQLIEKLLTESPVSTRRGAASSGWMRMVGGPARFSCAGTFAKMELMK